MTHKALIATCSLVSLLSACGGDDSGSLYGTAGTATLTAGNDSTTSDDPSGDGDPSTSGDGDGDATTSGGGIKLDIGTNDDDGMATGGDAGDGNGCKKVDFLFVIDNSGSMLEEQNNLKSSFPAFINSISSTLDEAQDYHIMVVDSDAWVYSGCPLLCGFGLPLLCQGFTCNDPNTPENEQTQPMQCEAVIGAGVTYPRGSDASNVDCNLADGKRYMTDTQPNLVGTFQCAASVGTGSTDDPERMMEAMVAAVQDPGPGMPAGNCNEGFLRDDAILVVTFITDEDDDAGDGSAGTVDSWRQALIDAKNGDESAIVVLGLFGDDDLPNAICGGAAESSARLRAFLDSWGGNGFFGSICADDYDGFFQQAVDIIDTTCDEFEPPK